MSIKESNARISVVIPKETYEALHNAVTRQRQNGHKSTLSKYAAAIIQQHIETTEFFNAIPEPLTTP